jgi:mono/diheme cytochrome c family protein
MQSSATRRSGLVSLLLGFCVGGCLSGNADPVTAPSAAPAQNPSSGAIPIPAIQQPGSQPPRITPNAIPCTSPAFEASPTPPSPIPFFPGMMSGSHQGKLAVRAEVPPPSISGGTLLATRDGKQLVASDPDRDLIYVIDIASHALVRTHQLNAGDEPGRLVEDAAGRIHVALRGGHAIASLTRDDTTPALRRSVCDLPRGLAYDAAHDALHVACAEGKLVSLDAAPEGAITRSVEIGRDARDVIVRGDRLFVTHFRSAELLTLDASGNTLQTQTPPTFSASETTFGPPTMSADGSCAITPFTAPVVRNTPTVAWRALDIPGRGVAMLHQRAREAEVQVTAGGYGLSNCGSGIVQSSITVGVDQGNQASADVGELSLAVDMAVDPDGVLLAVVAPGNWGTMPQLQMFKLNGSSVLNPPPSTKTDKPGPTSTAFPPAPGNDNPCLSPDSMFEDIPGQATAVAFISPYMLAVQQREPAAISFVDIRTGVIGNTLDLHQASRYDTGHELFHMRAGAGIACASCHAEGGDDGHVWTFHAIGARRTQNLRGGILGSEPFHWDGDMQDFPTLVREVFVGRMAGFMPEIAQTDALAQWIDRQPELKTAAHDASAVQRGKQLFESESTQCASCHSGELFTNNQLADVGTGAAFQVPALRGVSFRTPLMHDGCAKSLADRFGSCGGGDKHGRTSQLKPNELADMLSYLETL